MHIFKRKLDKCLVLKHIASDLSCIFKTFLMKMSRRQRNHFKVQCDIVLFMHVKITVVHNMFQQLIIIKNKTMIFKSQWSLTMWAEIKSLLANEWFVISDEFNSSWKQRRWPHPERSPTFCDASFRHSFHRCIPTGWCSRSRSIASAQSRCCLAMRDQNGSNSDFFRVYS